MLVPNDIDDLVVARRPKKNAILAIFSTDPSGAKTWTQLLQPRNARNDDEDGINLKSQMMKSI